jgi:hypothetical protein
MDFQLTSQGRESLKYGNEQYYEHRRGKRIPLITWRCRKSSQGCKAILKTLDGILIGSTNPNHIHGNPGAACSITSSSKACEDKHVKTINLLLHLIKTKSPKLNELSRKLNQPGSSIQKLHASTCMSPIAPDDDNSSNDLSEKEEEEKEKEEELNYLRQPIKSKMPIKWTKY